MTDDSGPPTEDWTGERTITEFWASIGQSNACNRLADRLPFGLGVILIYIPTYLINPFLVLWVIRYTLTTRRLRVEKGLQKKLIQSVALEKIEEIRLADEITSTRTGNLEIVTGGEVVLRMVGIQDPVPSRLTILDAIGARVDVRKAIERQQQGKEDEARILAEQKAAEEAEAAKA